MPILPGAKAEPIVAAGELAVDLIHQRRLHHRRRQAPHRNLRPTKEIFHVIHSRNPLQFDRKLTPSLQDRHPRPGILEELDRQDMNSSPEGIGFLPAKYGSDPRLGLRKEHESGARCSEHKLDAKKRARQGDCLFMKIYVVFWLKFEQTKVIDRLMTSDVIFLKSLIFLQEN